MPGLVRSLVMFLLLSGTSIAPVAAQQEEAPPGGDFVGADICAECHEEKFDQILPSKHAQMNDPRTPFAKEGCETCHGRGETHALSEGEEYEGLVIYSKDSDVPPEDQNARCLSCHQDTGRMHWQGSAHESADLLCTSCHLIHQPDGVLHKAREMDVCTTCHVRVRADIYKAYAHPIRQGQLTCSDCHSPHGSTTDKALNRLTLNQQCYSCHAEKRGPFLWEHEPAAEDCSSCHYPHGSNNPALLVRRGPMLCKECHQVTGFGGHINAKRDWGPTGNLRFQVAANCQNCHSQVHGSNHPSGAKLAR